MCQPFYPTLPHLADPLYPPFLVETEKPVTGPVDSVHFTLISTNQTNLRLKAKNPANVGLSENLFFIILF